MADRDPDRCRAGARVRRSSRFAVGWRPFAAGGGDLVPGDTGVLQCRRSLAPWLVRPVSSSLCWERALVPWGFGARSSPLVRSHPGGRTRSRSGGCWSAPSSAPCSASGSLTNSCGCGIPHPHAHRRNPSSPNWRPASRRSAADSSRSWRRTGMETAGARRAIACWAPARRFEFDEPSKNTRLVCGGSTRGAVRQGTTSFVPIRSCTSQHGPEGATGSARRGTPRGTFTRPDLPAIDRRGPWTLRAIERGSGLRFQLGTSTWAGAGTSTRCETRSEPTKSRASSRVAKAAARALWEVSFLA